VLPLDGSLQADVIQRGTPPNAEGVNPGGIRVFTQSFQSCGSPISTSPSLSLIALFLCWSYEIPMEVTSTREERNIRRPPVNASSSTVLGLETKRLAAIEIRPARGNVHHS